MGEVTEKFCDERHDGVTKEFITTNGRIDKLEEFTRKGFDTMETSIKTLSDMVNKKAIGILVTVIGILGTGFISVLVYAFFTTIELSKKGGNP